MTPTELYDQIATEFPPVWPQDPAWVWTNVHDGTTAKIGVIASILEESVGSSEIVVIVHSEPGLAVVLDKERAGSYIAEHLLKHELQASDPQLTCFVAFSRSGVAAKITKHAAASAVGTENDA